MLKLIATDIKAQPSKMEKKEKITEFPMPITKITAIEKNFSMVLYI